MRLPALMLLLAACAARTSPPADLPTEIPGMETLTLTLDPGALDYDEAAGTVTFTPDRDVQRASYETWIFDLASLEAALGERPAAPVDVVVEVGPPEATTYTPDDPNLPAPQGGFRITTRRGTVLRASR
jgi:hypothetical protein